MDEQADFVAKLRQIEESTFIAAGEAQVGSVKDHLRQVALIARTLRSRLEMGSVQVIAAPPVSPASYPDEDHSG